MHLFSSVTTDDCCFQGYCFIDYEIPEAAHLATEHMATSQIAGKLLNIVSTCTSFSFSHLFSIQSKMLLVYSKQHVAKCLTNYLLDSFC